MKEILIICSRELKSYFVSPIAYVVSCIFLFLSGLFFYRFVITYRVATSSFLGEYLILILFLAPLLTIRLFAEEKRHGTIELLLTSPLSSLKLVLGKFFAAFSLYLMILLVTFVYVFFLASYSNIGPDYGVMFMGYLGLILLGASLIAIGTFSSAITSSQVVAAISSFGISLFFLLVSQFSQGSNSFYATVFKELSLLEHYIDFYKGIFNSQHIVFYIFWVILSLLLANKAIESHIWK